MCSYTNSVCNQCILGYDMDFINGICVPKKVENCEIYDNKGECDYCALGSTIYTENKVKTCVSCEATDPLCERCLFEMTVLDTPEFPMAIPILRCYVCLRGYGVRHTANGS